MMTSFLEKYSDNISLDCIRRVIELNRSKYDLKNNSHLLPAVERLKNLNAPQFNPVEGTDVFFDSKTIKEIESIAKSLGKWRKGPYHLGPLHIDSEWRSDIKWDKISKKIPSLGDKIILDIGCNNGYFMFQMEKQRPKSVLGIDPVNYCEAQFNFLQHFMKSPNLFFEMLGINDVSAFSDLFDGIFNMGIIYHHPNPIDQLKRCHQALRKGGFIVLESITIPGNQSIALFPEDRYAKMRNVWFVPTQKCLESWLHKAKFKNIELAFDTKLTSNEQRVTTWSPGASLMDFLDPEDNSLTVEKYPAPRRAALIAYK